MAASLQREDNFVGVAHGIFEALASHEWHQHERRVLDVIFLETYGKQDPDNRGRQLMRARLSSQFIAEKTRLNARLVRIAITSLVERRVLTCFEEPSGSRPGVYGFQKYSDRWLGQKRTSRGSRSLLFGSQVSGKAGSQVSGKSASSDHRCPEKPDHRCPENPEGPKPLRITGVRLAGSQVSGLPDHRCPGKTDKTLTTTAIEAPVEVEVDSTDRSIDLPPQLFTEPPDLVTVDPYRTALQDIRLIFNSKEENRLREFQALEKSFPRERLLAALKRRVAEACGFADRTNRTCWALIKASEDLARPSVVTQQGSGHSPDHLEFEDEP